jgi:hypothetical protein
MLLTYLMDRHAGPYSNESSEFESAKAALSVTWQRCLEFQLRLEFQVLLCGYTTETS